MKSWHILVLIASVLFISGCKDNSEGQASVDEQVEVSGQDNASKPATLNEQFSKISVLFILVNPLG